MKYKIGDKIKFLNDTGGGVIHRLISPTMVSVTIEDGFIIPVMINEIIPAESSDPEAAVFNRDFSALTTNSVEKTEQDDAMERMSELQKFSSLNTKVNGVYLAYIPQDQVWLLKDSIDLYLVNYTSFEIVYSLVMQREHQLQGIDYGSVEPFSKIHIQTVEREDLDQWLHGFVQVLFFKEEDTSVRMPLHSPFTVQQSRFSKKESYTSTNFIAEKGLFVCLGQAVSDMQSREWEKDTKILQEIQSQSARIVEDEKPIDKYKTDPFTATVDLHLENMVDKPEKIEPAKRLELQRQLFLQCLESAIDEKLQKLIVIHGVGNGVLKHEIQTILKQYDNLHYFDASMQKYGCGATEILIKSTRKEDS
ncbi:MAG: DUF2027 domain-containing protein [Bacteroidales bacterium]|jgi:hypothetical protein|nr:DUF2027 domain-containing protein [Bacteroidales bacterium]